MAEHFASIGKRVMRDYDFTEGTVIDDRRLTMDGQVAVRWDGEEKPTLIYTFNIEPVE